MNEQVGDYVDLRLRQLLSNPRSSPPVSGTNAESIRVAASIVDALQIMAIGLVLRPLLPAAAAAISVGQAVGLTALAATLAAVARRSFRGRNRQSLDFRVFPAALGTFLAIAAEAGVSWITLSQSTTLSLSGRTVWFITWALTAAFWSACVRYFAAWLTARLERGHRIVVIGSPEQSNPIVALVKAAARGSWQLLGQFDDREPGALDDLMDSIFNRNVDVVALALAGADAAPRLAAICRHLADQPIRVCLALDPVALAEIPRAAACIRGVPLVDIVTDPHGGIEGALKRLMDILVGVSALFLLSPLLIIAALAIKLESPGPIIFRQWRFGLGSQPITVLKFRTMYSEGGDTKGELRTFARDSRVTKVGRVLRRTSADELPQLINVVRGTMSLVGPRPHPLHMRVGEQYYFEAVAHYRSRHLVKPGITGWAQINGSRGGVDTLKKAEHRVTLDLWYLENWTLRLDLRILLKTMLGRFLTIHAD